MWCVYYPDHIHCIWVLPEGDTNYSIRWKEIKRIFTRSYWDEIGPGEVRNESRLKRGEAAVWQRRFWEHTIRQARGGAKGVGMVLVELSPLRQDGVLRKGMGRGCRG